MELGSTVSRVGRVLAVRPRGDGTYAITIGPAPLVWFTATSVPRLGSAAEVRGVLEDVRELKAATETAPAQKLDVLAHAQLTITQVLPSRVVGETWVERAKGAIRRSARELIQYQADGAAWLASRLLTTGSILADEQGLGKTTTVIAAAVAAEAFPLIVVCPNVLTKNWEREFRYAARPLSITIVRKRKGWFPRSDVTIINYELMRCRDREVDLARIGARAIVFDEAHLLCQAKAGVAHRAAVATRLAHHIKRPVLVTGTPISNKFEDVWRLLHIVDPQGWPSIADFRERFVYVPEDDELVNDKAIVTSAGRAQRVMEFKARVQPIMLRRLRTEVAQQLPPKSRRSLLVEIDALDMAKYQAAQRDIVAWYRSLGAEQRASNAAQAVEIVKCNQLRQLAAFGKLRRAVPEYLTEWFRERREPLVVFGYHRQVLWGMDAPGGRGGIYGLCVRLGLRVVSIGRGGMKPGEEQAGIDAFQAGKADVCVASILAAGHGLNLQRAADALFVERVWVATKLLQSEDRIYRLGQTRPVVVTYMDAAGTIDEHLAEVNDGKFHLATRVLDDRVPEESEAFVARAILKRVAGEASLAYSQPIRQAKTEEKGTGKRQCSER